MLACTFACFLFRKYENMKASKSARHKQKCLRSTNKKWLSQNLNYNIIQILENCPRFSLIKQLNMLNSILNSLNAMFSSCEILSYYAPSAGAYVKYWAIMTGGWADDYVQSYWNCTYVDTSPYTGNESAIKHPLLWVIDWHIVDMCFRGWRIDCAVYFLQ